ncbi:NmrA family NAD(P)-binding protein [Dyadobacter psychrotolerans]|uniref:NAD-dependent epimerase/dehydratase family protein n=1 Tax=Dyadobacter psychrotolerans TaxID=2541721 RepID=A0A4R5DFK7_9BACT|nr:NmrA family NAD(P)-binding protein [Dyadobacter psychrotolerans]TDE10554.1 NAD-dependent epimerase/dehydratase family protein [Dyadobacter psychrotolerans]
MEKTILVAGGTGDLGGRIVRFLLEKGAGVRTIVRQDADPAKVEKLEALGVELIQLDMTDLIQLTAACEGVSCVISALQGLGDVIVDMQSAILEAAVKAGVPRFIPSDFSSDFTRLTPGENRNFDLRREFYERIDKSPIAATTIFNGAFAEILNNNIPFLDFKKKSVGYLGDPDFKLDFTTMDNAAEFTAAAALDDSTPRNLNIASFQVSANEMAELAAKVLGEEYKTASLGNIEDFAAGVKKAREANPDGEKELYPRWQQGQYIQSMFSVQNDKPDNDRYPDIKWTTLEEYLTARK